MIKLKHIKNKDFDNILKLTSNFDIMKWAGDGKIWDKKKVTKFINYTINEKNKKRRDYYFYKIVDDKIFIGIIGFYKFHKKDEFFSLRVFIESNYHGKGYFKETIKLLIKKVKKYYPNSKYLYSSVKKDNIRMNKIMNKNYKFKKQTKIKNVIYNLYKIKI